MSKRTTVADQLMAEVVLFGGLPLTRADAVRIMTEDGHGKAAIDWFVFGCLKAVTMKPISYAKFRSITV